MATKLKIPSAAKAKKYFQDKMAITTGSVELERWFKQGEPVYIFASMGYPVMELDGGWRWWKNDGFDIEK